MSEEFHGDPALKDLAFQVYDAINALGRKAFIGIPFFDDKNDPTKYIVQIERLTDYRIEVIPNVRGECRMVARFEPYGITEAIDGVIHTLVARLYRQCEINTEVKIKQQKFDWAGFSVWSTDPVLMAKAFVVLCDLYEAINGAAVEANNKALEAGKL